MAKKHKSFTKSSTKGSASKPVYKLNKREKLNTFDFAMSHHSRNAIRNILSEELEIVSYHGYFDKNNTCKIHSNILILPHIIYVIKVDDDMVMKNMLNTEMSKILEPFTKYRVITESGSKNRVDPFACSIFVISTLDIDTQRCPICYDTPRHAVLTVCGHIFCYSCLTGCFENDLHLYSSGKENVCPVCNRSMNIKTGIRFCFFTRYIECNFDEYRFIECQNHVEEQQLPMNYVLTHVNADKSITIENDSDKIKVIDNLMKLIFGDDQALYLEYVEKAKNKRNSNFNLFSANNWLMNKINSIVRDGYFELPSNCIYSLNQLMPFSFVDDLSLHFYDLLYLSLKNHFVEASLTHNDADMYKWLYQISSNSVCLLKKSLQTDGQHINLNNLTIGCDKSNKPVSYYANPLFYNEILHKFYFEKIRSACEGEKLPLIVSIFPKCVSLEGFNKKKSLISRDCFFGRAFNFNYENFYLVTGMIIHPVFIEELVIVESEKNNEQFNQPQSFSESEEFFEENTTTTRTEIRTETETKKKFNEISLDKDFPDFI